MSCNSDNCSKMKSKYVLLDAMITKVYCF